MKKNIYIQPKMEMAVMPKGALMDFPASPGGGLNPAPARQNFAPEAQPGQSGVWM